MCMRDHSWSCTKWYVGSLLSFWTHTSYTPFSSRLVNEIALIDFTNLLWQWSTNTGNKSNSSQSKMNTYSSYSYYYLLFTVWCITIYCLMNVYVNLHWNRHIHTDLITTNYTFYYITSNPKLSMRTCSGATRPLLLGLL